MRAAVPAVLLPRRHPQPRRAGDARARSTRAASSATRSCTPTAPRSTTPTCWSPAWSATARPRPARWPRSWHSNKFLNPARDGAVLPILHLNGYKIANPTVLARIPRRRARRAAARATATSRTSSTGDDPATVHQQLAATLDEVLDEIAEIQRAARAASGAGRPAALADDRAAHPEGLDRPEGGRRRAGRGHLARPPGAAGRRPATTPSTSASSRSGCAATGRRSCSTPTARLVAGAARRWRPTGDRRMSANPHANGGLLLRDLRLPDFRDYAVDGRRARRAASARPTAGARRAGCATSSRANPRPFRLFGPDETASNRLQARLRGDRPGLGRPRPCPATTTSPPTAG